MLLLPLVAGLAPQPQFRRRDALSAAAAAAAATTFSPAGRPPFVQPASASTAADAFAVSASLSPTVALASSAANALSEAERRAPRVGIGAWAWGDSVFWKYDPKNDEELREVFDYAVDQGVQFFDTAEVYGFGRSEELIGKFARQNAKAEGIEVATKFAALPWRTKPSDVVEAAKRSTERLGRPIDLYQIHFPNAWCNAQYWDGLADCVDRGLVKKVGVSNYGVRVPVIP